MLILSEEGVVFGIGSNEQGQLGLTNQVKIVSTPLHMGKEIFQISVLTLFIEEGIFIEDIECGANCSLFKSRANDKQEEQLYGCGLSTYGELGGLFEGPLSDGPHILDFEYPKIASGTKASHLSCGSTFSAILTGN